MAPARPQMSQSSVQTLRHTTLHWVCAGHSKTSGCSCTRLYTQGFRPFHHCTPNNDHFLCTREGWWGQQNVTQCSDQTGSDESLKGCSVAITINAKPTPGKVCVTPIASKCVWQCTPSNQQQKSMSTTVCQLNTCQGNNTCPILPNLCPPTNSV